MMMMPREDEEEFTPAIMRCLSIRVSNKKYEVDSNMLLQNSIALYVPDHGHISPPFSI